MVGRPFDVLRHEWHIYSLHNTSSTAKSQPIASTSRVAQSRFPPLLHLALKIIREEGIRGLFRGSPRSTVSSRPTDVGSWQSRAYPALRALARVGPWGVGFLVWEALGPGIQ
jgi:hypothetical protein